MAVDITHPNLCASLLLLVPLLLILIMRKKTAADQPPGPPKLPIIGNLHLIGTLFHRSLWELSQRYGPVMLLQLGSVPTLIVSSAEAAREVLKTHDLHTCSRPHLATTGKLSYNYLDVTFVPYGDYWREVRKICVLELFSAKRVQSSQFIREEEVRSMIDSIARSASTDNLVDIKAKMLSLTADIIFRVAFGTSFSGTAFDNDDFHEMVYEATAFLGRRSASDFFPSVGSFIDRLNGFQARLERIFHKLDAFYQNLIDDHLNPDYEQEKQKQEDIVDVLLSIERNKTGYGALNFTKDHIKAILMNVFLAGVDTSAITLTWAMAELARNPRVMQKATQEVRNCVGKKGKVSETELDQLQFLKMVVKETLRLHPPGVLLIPRETVSSFKLGGYQIHPKTRIHVNVWAIGRDPTTWTNPEEFFPERFLDSSIDFKGQHFELLPFGAGRRLCPGILMGVSMVELALASLLYHFDWKLPSGMKEDDIDMEEAPGQTIHMKSALKLLPIIHQWLPELKGD